MPAKNITYSSDTELDVKLVELKSMAVKILELEPKNTDALNSLGLVSKQLEDFEPAVDFFQRAHSIAPERQDYKCNLIESLVLLSKSMHDNGDASRAIIFLKRALLLRPGDVSLLCKLSMLLSLSNNYKEALVISEQAFLNDPESAQAYEANGLALLGSNRADLSISRFKKALKYDRTSASIHSNLGLAYRAKGDLNEAIKHFEKAINLDKNHIQAYNNLGVSFLDINDLGRAQRALQKAIEIDECFAEAHFNLSRVMLMGENFQMGWEHNEWRWHCSDFPSTRRNFPQPIWNGEDLRKKNILVWSEQGIGDEIMFASILPELTRDCANIFWECNERLVPIFRRSFRGVHVFPRQDPMHPDIKKFNADFQTALGSLCKFYRRKASDFPSKTRGFLKANPSLAREMRSRYSSLGSGLKIGISWTSGNPIVGESRSIPIKFWEEIFKIKNCHFINLQYGDYKEDLIKVLNTTGVRVFDDVTINPLNNAEHWFAQIAALDHVISVDNSTIQVSGALGIPTWTLVSHNPEWRFGLSRSDHLWHPSVRVFRQKKQGEWTSIMREIARALVPLIGN